MEELLFNYLSKFINISAEDKKIIAPLIQIQTCKKGEFLLQEGTKSQNSYLVIKGCLRSYYLIDAEEKTTEFFIEEDIITPICVIDQSKSKYNIMCMEDVVLLVSNLEIEEQGFSEFPEFEKLCRVMSDRELMRKHQDFDLFKLSKPEERYYQLLKNRPELIQRVPQYLLASYLGIKPQSLSRLRKRISSHK